MIAELLAAARALPRIVDALERLGDVATAAVVQRRKDEKVAVVDELIDAARERRLLKREAERISRDSDAERNRDGGGDID